MKVVPTACYGFSLLVGLFLVFYELNSDDTGLEVIFILMATFLLGCVHPRNAWQWALLIGPWAPAADLVQRLTHHAPRVEMHGSLLSVALAVVVIGLVGSYAGALVRKAVATVAGLAG
jgi:hypothetical protein